MSETWRGAWHSLELNESEPFETVDAFEAGWNAREAVIKAPILVPYELACVALGAAEFIRDEHGPDEMLVKLIEYLEGIGVNAELSGIES